MITRILSLILLVLVSAHAKANSAAHGFTPTELKTCDGANLNACFTSPDRDPSTGIFEASKSYVVLHHADGVIQKTEKVAVLIHGLLDSPYYMKDIAAILYHQGYNVLVARLSGHGTRPEELLDVTLADWRADVAAAIEYGQTLGRHLTVGGFSTGGALAIDAAYKSKVIEALLLFSPAVKFSDPMANFACLGWLIGSHWTQARVQETNPVEYQNMAVNGVCQLSKLINSISDFQFWWSLRALKPPVFMAYSEDDVTISPEAMKAVALKLTHPNSRVVVFSTGDSCRDCAPVGHGELPLATNAYVRARGEKREKANRRFEELAQALNGFLNH